MPNSNLESLFGGQGGLIPRSWSTIIFWSSKLYLISGMVFRVSNFKL